VKIYLDTHFLAVLLFGGYSLPRDKRLLFRKKFPIQDSTDEPHVICAYLNQCDVILTFDSHFKAVHHEIKVYTPDEFLKII